MTTVERKKNTGKESVSGSVGHWIWHTIEQS